MTTSGSTEISETGSIEKPNNPDSTFSFFFRSGHGLDSGNPLGLQRYGLQPLPSEVLASQLKDCGVIEDAVYIAQQDGVFIEILALVI